MSKPNQESDKPFIYIHILRSYNHFHATVIHVPEPVRPSPAEIPARPVTRVTSAAASTDDMKKASSSPATLGILSFEAAKSMSRLVALYNAISDDEVRRLRTEIITSRGVAYLNSGDEGRLLFLACAEHLGELNASAEAVARLSQKCSHPELVRFDLIYDDLKLGLIDPRKTLEFGSKNVIRIVEKMDKLARSTAELYVVTEALTELEHSEKKIEKWKKTAERKQFEKTNFNLFHRKVGHLRKQLQSLRDHSLWNMTYDKTVSLMARTVCVVFAQISVVYGPQISELTTFKTMQSNIFHSCRLEDRKFHERNRKLEIKNRETSGSNSTNHSNIFLGFDKMTGCDIGLNHDTVSRLAGASTVGASAMTVRYANLIVLAERCLLSPETVSEATREGLYEMLPESLRRRVAAQLKHSPTSEDSEEVSDGNALASGWREALEEMMTWLAPVAHNTVTWQSVWNMERQRCGLGAGGERPAVMLVETLHFSDLEKTEAAIVEVLVGLSRVFRYENLGHSFGNKHNHSPHRQYQL